jgi:UDP-N-acetylmuramate dehydrogenase
MNKILMDRRVKFPMGRNTAGSVFRNPNGKPAWKLIDEVGLRGHHIGGAVVSEKHCNFIINDGGATSNDVLDLIERARSRVRGELGVKLDCEIRYVHPDDGIVEI